MFDIKQARMSVMPENLGERLKYSLFGRQLSPRHSDLTLSQSSHSEESFKDRGEGDFAHLLRSAHSPDTEPYSQDNSNNQTQARSADHGSLQSRSTSYDEQGSRVQQQNSSSQNVDVASTSSDDGSVSRKDAPEKSQKMSQKGDEQVSKKSLANFLLNIFSLLEGQEQTVAQGNSSKAQTAEEVAMTSQASKALKNDPKLAALLNKLAADIERLVGSGRGVSLPKGAQMAQWLEKSGLTADLKSLEKALMTQSKAGADVDKDIAAIADLITRSLPQEPSPVGEGLGQLASLDATNSRLGKSGKNGAGKLAAALKKEKGSGAKEQDVDGKLLTSRDKDANTAFSSHVSSNSANDLGKTQALGGKHPVATVMGKIQVNGQLSAKQQKALERLKEFAERGQVRDISVTNTASEGAQAQDGNISRFASAFQNTADSGKATKAPSSNSFDLSGVTNDLNQLAHLASHSGGEQGSSGKHSSGEETMSHLLKDGLAMVQSGEGGEATPQDASFLSLIEGADKGIVAQKNNVTSPKPTHEIVHEALDFFTTSGMRDASQTLRMTVMSADAKPVNVRMENIGNGGIGIVLQAGDDEMLHKLSGVKQELLAALDAAEVKMDHLEVKIAPVENTQTDQNSTGDMLSQNDSGGAGLMNNFSQGDNSSSAQNHNFGYQPLSQGEGQAELASAPAVQSAQKVVVRGGKNGVNITV